MRAPVKARAVQIHPANGGYVVTVGCQTFVYGADEVTELTVDLTSYLLQPEAVEKEWRENQPNEPGEIAVPTPYATNGGYSGYSR
jgi:hypothetical protein